MNYLKVAVVKMSAEYFLRTVFLGCYAIGVDFELLNS
jgi:hypothetical protein